MIGSLVSVGTFHLALVPRPTLLRDMSWPILETGRDFSLRQEGSYWINKRPSVEMPDLCCVGGL